MPDKIDAPVRARPNLLAFTLAGLPELSLFDSDEQRRTALDRIASAAGNPTKGGRWLAMAILLPAMVAAVWFTRFLRTRTAWPGWVEEFYSYVLIGLAFALVLRWLHRSGAARELREELLRCGIAVCRGCGYCLRGHTAQAAACPECARPLDERVKELLSRPAPPP